MSCPWTDKIAAIAPTEVDCVTASFLEIVELANGEFVLRRAEEEGEALVTIRFSQESRLYMQDGGLDVARAMIQAGIQVAAQMAESGELETDTYLDDEQAPILH